MVVTDLRSVDGDPPVLDGFISRITFQGETFNLHLETGYIISIEPGELLEHGYSLKETVYGTIRKP